MSPIITDSVAQYEGVDIHSNTARNHLIGQLYLAQTAVSLHRNIFATAATNSSNVKETTRGSGIY